MSLNAQPHRPMPPEIAAWGVKHLAADSPYRLVGETLYAQFHDLDFADLYHVEGKPALSPVTVALVTVFQHLENLADRGAANAVRTRLDWKFALHLPLDDDGFDASVLGEFRQRLLDHAAGERIFAQVLAHLSALGLLKKRGTQRSDSTHVLAAVRSLNRLETVGEALRLALNALALAAPDWLLRQVTPAWEQRYGPRFTEWHLPNGQEKREAIALQIGRDGQHMLLAIYAPDAPAELRTLPEVEILRQIWVQQYMIDGEQLHWRDPKDLPPARMAINSPYDVEVRYSHRRSTILVGYKVHLTEACDEDAPRLITNVELTPAPPADYEMTATIHQHLAKKEGTPSMHLVDAGYVDAEQLVASQRDYQIDRYGPVVQNGTWQAKEGKGYDSAQFRVDWDTLVAPCPQGKTRRVGRSYPEDHGNPMMTFDFRAADCRACPVRSDCTRSESPYRGRMIGMRLREARVLDVGCGPDHDAAQFQACGLRAYGLDRSRGMLREARQRTDVPLLLSDMRCLPFCDDTFDGLWVSASFLHIPRRDNLAVLRELGRVLRPEGVLSIGVKEGNGERYVSNNVGQAALLCLLPGRRTRRAAGTDWLCGARAATS